MSAEQIAAANGEVISGGAAQQIDEAIGQLLDAQSVVRCLQEEFSVGGPYWHKLETIDDCLHVALAKLGN